MKTLVGLFVVTLGFRLFAAELTGKAVTNGPVVTPAVRVEPLVPAGQTFSRPGSTFSPAIPPEMPVKGGTFSRPESTFSRPGSTFSRPPSTFSRESTFSTPAGSFAHPGPTFSTPAGSFSRPASTFLNPTKGTSPLPIGAFGTPIRPASTFARPPGVTFGGSSGGILATPNILVPVQEATTVVSEPEYPPVTTESKVEPPESAAINAPTEAAVPVVVDFPPGARIRK